jgi:hypothetical protein
MKKVSGLLVGSLFFLICGTVFAEGSQEKIRKIDQEFFSKTWDSRENWIYEANLEVANIMDQKNHVLEYLNKRNFNMATYYIPDFDAGCYRYSKILEAGVSHGFINENVMEEQKQKLLVYREEVSAAVRQSSGGLGIE